MIARILFPALVLSLVTGLVARGQASPRPARDSVSMGAGRMIALSRTSHIKFVPHFGPRIRGHDPLISGDSLHVQVGRESQAFALANIDTIWVRRGTWARDLGIATGVVGAAFGGLAAVALGHDDGHHPSPGEQARAIVEVGAVLGAIGAIPGAAIGSIFPRWERIYVRGGNSP